MGGVSKLEGAKFASCWVVFPLFLAGGLVCLCLSCVVCCAVDPDAVANTLRSDQDVAYQPLDGHASDDVMHEESRGQTLTALSRTRVDDVTTHHEEEEDTEEYYDEEWRDGADDEAAWRETGGSLPGA